MELKPEPSRPAVLATGIIDGMPECAQACAAGMAPCRRTASQPEGLPAASWAPHLGVVSLSCRGRPSVLPQDIRSDECCQQAPVATINGGGTVAAKAVSYALAAAVAWWRSAAPARR
jgi:hypothetical protein